MLEKFIALSLLWNWLSILLFNTFSVFQPSKPDKTSADPNSWIALECGASEKYSATGAQAKDVPFAVYSNFPFMQTELESGWFAIKIEPDDKDDYGVKNLTKVCTRNGIVTSRSHDVWWETIFPVEIFLAGSIDFSDDFFNVNWVVLAFSIATLRFSELLRHEIFHSSGKERKILAYELKSFSYLTKACFRFSYFRIFTAFQTELVSL